MVACPKGYLIMISGALTGVGKIKHECKRKKKQKFHVTPSISGDLPSEWLLKQVALSLSFGFSKGCNKCWNLQIWTNKN